jgi:hypothetical protein
MHAPPEFPSIGDTVYGRVAAVTPDVTYVDLSGGLTGRMRRADVDVVMPSSTPHLEGEYWFSVLGLDADSRSVLLAIWTDPSVEEGGANRVVPGPRDQGPQDGADSLHSTAAFAREFSDE